MKTNVDENKFSGELAEVQLEEITGGGKHPTEIGLQTWSFGETSANIGHTGSN